MAEMERAPMGLLDAILTFRGYANLYRELKAAEARHDDKTTHDDRFSVIYDIQFELLQQRNARRTERT